MDINLPGINAYQALKILLDEPETRAESGLPELPDQACQRQGIHGRAGRCAEVYCRSIDQRK